MTADETKRYDELLQRAQQCLDKAQAAIERDSPVGAREWFEAHDAAVIAARRLKGAHAR
jgi:hypothetical protein